MGKDIKFDFENISLEDFLDPENMSIRFHITNVWHEMGHLIGHSIANEIKFDFGNVIKIDFGIKPEIFNNCKDYEPDGEILICTDSEGQQYHYLNDPKDIVKISKAINNKERTLAYLIYLMCGGFFNIYIVKKKPNDEDLENCFFDDIKCVEKYGFCARAGYDWSVIRRIVGTQQWNLEIIKDFRRKVYWLFIKFDLFMILSPLLHEIDSSYNGQIIEEAEIKPIYSSVENILKKVKTEFWSQISEIISETAGEI